MDGVEVTANVGFTLRKKVTIIGSIKNSFFILFW